MLKWKKDYLTGEGIEDPEKIKNKLDAGEVCTWNLSSYFV